MIAASTNDTESMPKARSIPTAEMSKPAGAEPMRKLSSCVPLSMALPASSLSLSTTLGIRALNAG